MKNLNITAENIRTQNGHDGGGYFLCEVICHGELIAYMSEDTHGGGYIYHPITGKKALLKILRSNDLDGMLYDIFVSWNAAKDKRK